MPYISKQDRERWVALVRAFWDGLLSAPGVYGATPGEINYIMTKLLLAWLGSAPRYEDYNAAIGALECVKLELYRRAVAPYEDEKCSEHGDVY